MRCRSLLGTLATIMLLTSCGGGSDWETVSVEGTNTKFELPGPIKETEDEKGMDYQAKRDKVLCKIGVRPRDNADQDRARGYTDEYVVQAYANGMLDKVTQSLAISRLKPDIAFNGAIEGKGSVGLQYTVKVGNRTVVNRFYVTDANFYYVEVSMDDPEDPDAQRVLDSIQI